MSRFRSDCQKERSERERERDQDKHVIATVVLLDARAALGALDGLVGLEITVKFLCIVLVLLPDLSLVGLARDPGMPIGLAGVTDLSAALIATEDGEHRVVLVGNGVSLAAHSAAESCVGFESQSGDDLESLVLEKHIWAHVDLELFLADFVLFGGTINFDHMAWVKVIEGD